MHLRLTAFTERLLHMPRFVRFGIALDTAAEWMESREAEILPVE